MRRKFIVNPAAGRGRVGRALDELTRDFTVRAGGFDHVVTSSRDHAIESTRAALRAGYEQIVAIGGDGTVNAVVNGFFEGGKALAPEALLVVAGLGTGCDYYAGLAGGAPWRDLVTRFDARPVDVAEIGFPDGRPSVFFVNVGSVGLSAEVVVRQRSLPAWLPPLASYALPALGALVRSRPLPLRVTIDGSVHEGNFLNVFFAKGKTCGGGMRLGGGVALDDGFLDVTLIHARPLATSLPRFGKLFTGRFAGDPMFTKARARAVEVHAPEPLRVECDGEIVGVTDIRVTLREKALRVCFPRG